MAIPIRLLSALRRHFPIEFGDTNGGPNLEGTLQIGLTGTRDDGTEGRTATVDRDVRLVGPGEVRRVLRDAVLRRHPEAGAHDFEPNYFVFAEFPPDFCWRYSLDPPDAGRPQPWLALLVVSGEEAGRAGELLDQESRARVEGQPCLYVEDELEYARVMASALPPVGEDDAHQAATAHVHLHRYDGQTPVEEFIAANPDACRSRLFCFRKLEADTAYQALLVPYYSAALDDDGQTAASALTITDGVGAADADAGGDGGSSGNPPHDTYIDLPVYDRWSFRTSESGDFEALVRRLTPMAAPPGTGTRVVDASFNELDAEPADRLFHREGALAAPGYSAGRAADGAPGGGEADDADTDGQTEGGPADGGDPAPVPYVAQLEVQRRTREVAARVNAGEYARVIDGDDDEEEDPLISMPLYGRTFRDFAALPVPDGDDAADGDEDGAGLEGGNAGDSDDEWTDPGDWREELNLDFRNRIAAGLGVRAVRREDERYARASWEQVGAIRKANQALRLAQAGMRLGRVLARRRLKALNADRFALRTANFHAHVPVEEAGESRSFQRFFPASGLVSGILQPAFTRIVHQRIGLDRLDVFRPWKLARRHRKGRPRGPNVEYDLTDRARRELGIDVPAGEREVRPLPAEVVPVTPLDDLDRQFRRRFDGDAVARRCMKAIIRFNDETRALSDELDPLLDSPEIDRPMYEPLAELSLDYVLPGLDRIAGNSVLLAEENQVFIHSYLVGANDAVIEDLMWRGFPLEPRRTVFHHFWEPTLTDGGREDGYGRPGAMRDILDIRGWTERLGRNSPADARESNIVLVIKGDLPRRYPETIIFAARLDGDEYWSEVFNDDGVDVDDVDGLEVIQPVFRGRLGRDALAVGFPFTEAALREPGSQYYFFLVEPDERPRFGLDVASRAAREGTPDENDLQWSDVTVDPGTRHITDWGSALAATGEVGGDRIARRTLQRPVRMIVHASRMLSDADV